MKSIGVAFLLVVIAFVVFVFVAFVAFRRLRHLRRLRRCLSDFRLVLGNIRYEGSDLIPGAISRFF